MKLKPFELEKYFSKYEFSAKHLLSCSDCESYEMSALLQGADTQALSLWNNLSLSYTPSQGSPMLLNEISTIYQNIIPSDILHVIPEEGIYIAMRTLVSQGDEVIIMHPCYQSLEEVALSQGAKVLHWNAVYDNSWSFNTAALDEMCSKNTHMIVINTPHNPTGFSFTKSEFAEIIKIAKKNNCILFSDEMYRFLEFDSNNRLPSACEVYEGAVVLCGLSKSFAMPGLRLGWLITKNRSFFNEFKNNKDYTTICASAPSQALGIMALRQKEKILNRNLEIIYKNLVRLDEFAAKYKSLVSYNRPTGGSICMPVLDKSISADALAQQLIIEKSLMILPASVYHIKTNAFRLGFGRKDFIESLDILDSFLEQYFIK